MSKAVAPPAGNFRPVTDNVSCQKAATLKAFDLT